MSISIVNVSLPPVHSEGLTFQQRASFPEDFLGTLLRKEYNNKNLQHLQKSCLTLFSLGWFVVGLEELGWILLKDSPEGKLYNISGEEVIGGVPGRSQEATLTWLRISCSCLTPDSPPALPLFRHHLPRKTSDTHPPWLAVIFKSGRLPHCWT